MHFKVQNCRFYLAQFHLTQSPKQPLYTDLSKPVQLEWLSLISPRCPQQYALQATRPPALLCHPVSVICMYYHAQLNICPLNRGRQFAKNYDDSGRSLKTAVRRGPKYLNPAMCLTAIFYILSSPPRRLVLRLSKILVDNRDFFIPHLLSMPPFWGLRQNIAVRFGTENLE